MHEILCNVCNATIAAASCSNKTKVIHINVTNNSVHTILLPQNFFCYMVLHLVAKVCYHQKNEFLGLVVHGKRRRGISTVITSQWGQTSACNQWRQLQNAAWAEWVIIRDGSRERRRENISKHDKYSFKRLKSRWDYDLLEHETRTSSESIR